MIYFIMMLICISLTINDILQLFIYLLVICMFSFINVHFLYYYIFNWVILLLFCYQVYEFLYILNINPSSNRWFEIIFAHSISCLCFLLMVSFSEKKLFSMMSCLFIFYFVTLTFGVKFFKKLLKRVTWRSLSKLIFSPRNFSFQSYIQIFSLF